MLVVGVFLCDLCLVFCVVYVAYRFLLVIVDGKLRTHVIFFGNNDSC